jgi:hypothetical protein
MLALNDCILLLLLTSSIPLPLPLPVVAFGCGEGGLLEFEGEIEDRTNRTDFEGDDLLVLSDDDFLEYEFDSSESSFSSDSPSWWPASEKQLPSPSSLLPGVVPSLEVKVQGGAGVV